VTRRARYAFTIYLILRALPAAAEYPDRSLRLIMSSASGASSDVVSRILAAELVLQMGQQIIIDNRPGAVQTPGTAMIASEPGWLHDRLCERRNARHQ
jgi:tripartite-type tricarboxylate transporter receptor subunit TctC